MKKINQIALGLQALASGSLLAHNVGDHNHHGHEGLWHYLTEWHHGGPYWVAAFAVLAMGSLYLKKSKSSGK